MKLLAAVAARYFNCSPLILRTPIGCDLSINITTSLGASNSGLPDVLKLCKSDFINVLNDKQCNIDNATLL
jgi:hypothetical protein